MKKLNKTLFAIVLFGILWALLAFSAGAANNTVAKIKSFSVQRQGSASVTLDWKTDEGSVGGFKLYKFEKAKNKNTLIASIKKDVRSFKVTSLIAGTDYCFKIKAYSKTKDGTVYSDTLMLETYTLVPKVTGLKLKSNSDINQELTWKAIKGIKTYNIYYLNKSTGKYVLMGSKNENSAIIKCAPATVYTYKVKAVAKVLNNKKTLLGASSDPLETISKSAFVSTFLVESKTTSSVTIKWGAVQKANGYKIYRAPASGKNYKLIMTLKNATSATISGLASAKNYKFRIKSFTVVNGKTVLSDSSATLSITTKPINTTVSQEADVFLNGKVNLSWTEVERATGYLIYVSDKKDSGFSLYKEVSAPSTSATLTGMKNGSAQYVKIKAYVVTDGIKDYGDYSRVITVLA